MGTLKSWLTSTDHKRIGLLYLFGSLAAFVLAGFGALVIRIQQFDPGMQVVTGQTYNTVLYFHGAAMILAFLIPGLTGFFGNYFIPLMIGARDVAFPRLNALGLHLFLAGIVLALISIAVPDAPDVLWTGYPPYSIRTTANTAFYVFTVHLFSVSSILNGINLIVTVMLMRAPNIGWNQLNMSVWCILGALLLNLIDIPVLAAAVTMLLTDKYFGTHFFDASQGGDAVIYQNLFWFYSHPAVYVIFLPAMGILFDVIATMAKNRVFNYKAAVYMGVVGVCLMSGEVWVHHIFTSGMPDWIRVVMMITTLLISVPVGVMVISLWGTLHRGAITYNLAMSYAAACLFLLLVGGLTGIPLAMVSLNLHLHGSAYVHAHFHFVMALFATFAFLSGLYYWFPKITGRLADTRLARIGFWVNILGVNLTFWPLLIIGEQGMPRRYWDYSNLPGWFAQYHHIATVGAFVTALAMALILGNLIYCALRGQKAPANPWKSQSLEWTHAANPPLPRNFESEPALASDWSPYEYQR
ncbi:MAG: cbb3-type cytochrome c oxidase subunit I [Rhodospirillaceae bacterium]